MPSANQRRKTMGRLGESGAKSYETKSHQTKPRRNAARRGGSGWGGGGAEKISGKINRAKEN